MTVFLLIVFVNSGKLTWFLTFVHWCSVISIPISILNVLDVKYNMQIEHKLCCPIFWSPSKFISCSCKTYWDYSQFFSALKMYVILEKGIKSFDFDSLITPVFVCLYLRLWWNQVLKYKEVRPMCDIRLSNLQTIYFKTLSDASLVKYQGQ